MITSAAGIVTAGIVVAGFGIKPAFGWVIAIVSLIGLATKIGVE